MQRKLLLNKQSENLFAATRQKANTFIDIQTIKARAHTNTVYGTTPIEDQIKSSQP